jgi:hypothetical protein
MNGLSLRVAILWVSEPFQLAVPKKRATYRIREVLEIDLTNIILSSGQLKGSAKHYDRHKGAHQPASSTSMLGITYKRVEEYRGLGQFRRLG